MQWQYRNDRGVAVLELIGFLGDAALDQFGGAVGWALARSGGPIVIDLTRLQGWSVRGGEAIIDLGERLGAHDRRLAVCGRGATLLVVGLTRNTGPGTTSPHIGIFADVDSAVTALGPMGSEGGTRSSGPGDVDPGVEP
jgi:hypothetical protein